MSSKRPLSVSQSEGANTGDNVWKKLRSEKYNSFYWFNTVTNQSVWEDPTKNNTSNSNTNSEGQDRRPTKERKLAFAESVCKSVAPIWKKGFSEKYKRDYWFDEVSGKQSWEDPEPSNQEPIEEAVQGSNKSSEFCPTRLVLTDSSAIEAELAREKRAVAVDAPECPREITTANLTHIVHRLRTESAAIVYDKSPSAEHPIMFQLQDDDTAMITRAVQEDQILKTRLKVQLREGVADLPSFWDVWEKDPEFREIIIKAQDPNEAKWQCQKTHNYKVATTFMPAYAKALYEHFEAKSVLDPCAGWGDRLVGAASSSIVEQYVCFDPNTTLRPGYADLMKLFGHSVTSLSAKTLKFSNGFEQHALPFEEGALQLADNSFDLVFTSPPFFDYEMYNPNNPQYTDWIEQFYKPLFIQACRCVKPGHHFAIHVGDTSAGQIGVFLKTQVQRICALKLVSRIGLHGMMSKKTRSVWIYRKAMN